jgi:hypothetical protein
MSGKGVSDAARRGPVSACGGETVPGAPRSAVDLGDTLARFFDPLDRGVIGLSVSSASRRSIALVSKCSSWLFPAASRRVTSPCIAWVSRTSVGSSEGVGARPSCPGATRDVWLRSAPTSETCPEPVDAAGGPRRSCGVGGVSSAAGRSLAWLGMGCRTGARTSCRACHGASQKRLTSSARVVTPARARSHTGRCRVLLHLAMTLCTRERKSADTCKSF